MKHSSPGRLRGHLAPLALLLGLSLWMPAGRAKAEEPVTRSLGAATWTDIQGVKHGPEEISAAKATVFFFSSTQCPVANQYTPRMNALAGQYLPKGVKFFLVNSNTEDSAETLKKYAAERKFVFPVVKDQGTTLADKLGALYTPEAIVVDAAGTVRYLGQIDDNLDPTRIVRHDLRAALEAVLEGRPVTRARTLVTGCAIFRDKPVLNAEVSKAAVTFTRDIAPILNTNCVGCHRKGEVAPFSLETYRQAKVWSSQIKAYTARKIMPPWKPVPGFGDFHDSNVLTEKQIAVLAKWADAGAPEGDPKDLPSARTFPDPAAWTLGKPDMIVQPLGDYHLEAEGKDVYRNFVLPVDFKEDRYLTGMEFKPGNRAVVHHIVVYFDPTGKSAKLDGKETEPGYTVPGTGIGVEPAEWGDVWVPGSAPRFLPPGVVTKIPAGAKFVMQVHYHKSGKPETDRSQLALYFVKGAPEHVIQVIPAGNVFFNLRPGETRQEVKGLLPTPGSALPVDAKLWSIFPHMHMLGHEMKVTATLPNGTVKTLIWINDWDFNWQATYYYKEPILLPKGTKIEMVATYDNSDTNPRQTSHPPKPVRFGEQTTDEMCFVFLGLTLDKGESFRKGSGASAP